MVFIYHILYRNGQEDRIEVNVSSDDEEGVKGIGEVNEVIRESFRTDENAIITLGDGKLSGSYIRLSDVIRVRIEANEY